MKAPNVTSSCRIGSRSWNFFSSSMSTVPSTMPTAMAPLINSATDTMAESEPWPNHRPRDAAP
ncbi:hypothetical protein D3C80_1632900 [compost metagenome]